MKNKLLFCISLIALAVPVLLYGQDRDTRQSVLWYRNPAPVWDQALPVGNGRLGAMVFGGANRGANNGDLQDARQNASLLDGSQTSAADEHLQLNEATIWQGGRVNRLNPQAGNSLPRIRQLLLDSKGQDGAKISAAEKLVQESLIGIPSSMPGYSTLGDLYLKSANSSGIQDYHRELDLATGVARIRYTQNGVHFSREVFASTPEDVIVVRITADRKGAISFLASMDRPDDFQARTEGNNLLVLREGATHPGKIHFAGEVLLLPIGGKARPEPHGIAIENADSVTLLIAAATDFKGGSFTGGDPEAKCAAALQRARTLSPEQLLDHHLRFYRPLFERMSLHLGQYDQALAALPTNERVQRVSAGADDLGLQRLYFEFARYLLISSYRADGLPATLQGLWAGGINNPWGSKWTININTEMNYWLAEPAGLGETTMPLVNLINMARNPLSGTASKVAHDYYGARGFVLHHNTDIWGDSEPIDGYQWGIWPMGGAWLSLHAWDHYAFTLDKAYLRERAWPILHDASLFFLDSLMDDGKGHLVTAPSISPENSYRLPDGSVHSVTMGPTMDMEIARELFTRTLDAGRILGEDAGFLKQVEAARAKLPPFAIGKNGRLQEWQQDYEDAEPGHRHISHLWALFPGDQISLAHTPELAQAARTTLETRLAHGGGQTGWSRAWVVNYWDHLHDGGHAYESLQVMFRQSTFPNLMDTHPPGVFQIDGNLGAANGMLEALVQSRWQEDAVEVELLPALPAQWPDGEVRGVHLRGAATMDMQWKAGQITQLTVHAEKDLRVRLIAPAGHAILSAQLLHGGATQKPVQGILELSGGQLYSLLVQ